METTRTKLNNYSHSRREKHEHVDSGHVFMDEAKCIVGLLALAVASLSRDGNNSQVRERQTWKQNYTVSRNGVFLAAYLGNRKL